MAAKLGPNRMLPRIKYLTTRFGYSYPTVRKAIQILENEGRVENFGSLGFQTTVIYDTWLSQQKGYLTKAKSNLEIAKLLNEGAKLYGRFAILFGQTISAIDIINGRRFETNQEEVEEAVLNPLALDIIETAKGKKQRILMSKFMRQSEIRDVARVIYSHRENKYV
jgi:hypothetical protein